MSRPRPLYHLALRLEGEPCLVVGGGPVAARKAVALLECGALVTVVAPDTCAALEALPLHVERRTYESPEASAYRLVVTATGIGQVDRAVYLDARSAGVLVNAADCPEACSFLVPAVHRSGAVSVAVSTGGSSPWLAGWVRDRVASVVDADVAALAEIVAEARKSVLDSGGGSSGLDWAGLVEDHLWPLVRAGEILEARLVAKRWVEAC